MKSTLLVFLLLEAAARSQTIVNFDPSNPNIGPFPTDYLTVADATQKTGLRVNLPLPDCGPQPTACQLARAPRTPFPASCGNYGRAWINPSSAPVAATRTERRA